jgi:hypothetical protein
MEYRREVWKITERRKGAIYKSVKICDLWMEVKPRSIEEENQIAKDNGGDMLVSTNDYR